MVGSPLARRLCSPSQPRSAQPGGGSRAWTDPPSEGGGALAAGERAGAGALAPSGPSLGHTGHREAGAAGPRTLWARWNACAWACGTWVGSWSLHRVDAASRRGAGRTTTAGRGSPMASRREVDSLHGPRTSWWRRTMLLGCQATGVIRSDQVPIWTRPRCQGTLEWTTRFGTDAAIYPASW